MLLKKFLILWKFSFLVKIFGFEQIFSRTRVFRNTLVYRRCRDDVMIVSRSLEHARERIDTIISVSSPLCKVVVEDVDGAVEGS